ncbi:MAG: Mpo1-like protein [Bacteroidia bacterium]
MGWFTSFWEFYNTLYLKEHSNTRNQIIHFFGTTSFIVGIVISIIFKIWFLIPVAIFAGYLFPHIGHKHFQGNESLRKSNPVYCVLGAAVMYFHNLGRLITKGKI